MNKELLISRATAAHGSLFYVDSLTVGSLASIEQPFCRKKTRAGGQGHTRALHESDLVLIESSL